MSPEISSPTLSGRTSKLDATFLPSLTPKPSCQSLCSQPSRTLSFREGSVTPLSERPNGLPHLGRSSELNSERRKGSASPVVFRKRKPAGTRATELAQNLLATMAAEWPTIRALNLGVQSGTNVVSSLGMSGILRDVRELNSLCIHNEEASDAIGKLAQGLSHKKRQHLLVLFDTTGHEFLSDFLRIMVFNTSQLMATAPVDVIKYKKAAPGGTRKSAPHAAALRPELRALSSSHDASLCSKAVNGRDKAIRFTSCIPDDHPLARTAHTLYLERHAPSPTPGDYGQGGSRISGSAKIGEAKAGGGPESPNGGARASGKLTPLSNCDMGDMSLTVQAYVKKHGVRDALHEAFKQGYGKQRQHQHQHQDHQQQHQQHQHQEQQHDQHHQHQHVHYQKDHQHQLHEQQQQQQQRQQEQQVDADDAGLLPMLINPSERYRATLQAVSKDVSCSDPILISDSLPAWMRVPEYKKAYLAKLEALTRSPDATIRRYYHNASQASQASPASRHNVASLGFMGSSVGKQSTPRSPTPTSPGPLPVSSSCTPESPSQ